MISNTINVYANAIGMVGISPLETGVARPGHAGARHSAQPTIAGVHRSKHRTGGRGGRANGQRAMCSGKRQIAANSSASRLAPPMSAPSTSGLAMIGGDVRRLHGAAVLDPDGVRGRLPVRLDQPGPDRAADLLGVLGGRRLAGADRPHRLVRDDDLLHLLGGQPRRGPVQLVQHVGTWLPASRTSRPSPQQKIGVMPFAKRSLHLGVDQCVVLVVVLAALGVPDHDVACSPAWPASHRRSPRCTRRPACARDVLRAVADEQLVAVDRGLHACAGR